MSGSDRIATGTPRGTFSASVYAPRTSIKTHRERVFIEFRVARSR